MIAMAVGAEQDVSFLDVFFVCGTHGITGKPRVDVEGFPFRCLKAKRGMTEPSKLNSFEIHKALLEIRCELAF